MRLGAAGAEKIGLDTSSKYLKHFLDGSGKDIVVSRDEARKDPFIRDSEAENRTRFENKTFLGDTKNSKLNDSLLTLKDGQSVNLTDDWDSDSRYDGSPKGTFRDPSTSPGQKLDRFLALGTQKLKSESGFEATRHGNKIHIKGTVSHNAGDTYDFDDNDESLGAYELQQSGRGKPFKIVRNWQQTVEGTVDILDTDDHGRLILGNPKFQWRDRN